MEPSPLHPKTPPTPQTSRRGRQFFPTAAPQCKTPDADLGSLLNAHMDWFDAVFMQFYNNPSAEFRAGIRSGLEDPRLVGPVL